jgi:hypothetical protein
MPTACGAQSIVRRGSPVQRGAVTAAVHTRSPARPCRFAGRQEHFNHEARREAELLVVIVGVTADHHIAVVGDRVADADHRVRCERFAALCPGGRTNGQSKRVERSGMRDRTARHRRDDRCLCPERTRRVVRRMGLTHLDAGVIIGFLDGNDAHHHAARGVLVDALRAGDRLAMASSALAECLDQLVTTDRNWPTAKALKLKPALKHVRPGPRAGLAVTLGSGDS